MGTIYRNGGATYSPVKWTTQNEGCYTQPKATCSATCPNDLHSVYFSSHTTDNTKYVSDRVDSINGSLFSASASRKEWL